MIWSILYLATFFPNVAEGYNSNTIESILKHLTDCQFNAVKIENVDVQTAKSIMTNGLYLAMNTMNASVLTLNDDLSLHLETLPKATDYELHKRTAYFSQFKLCQNVLMTNTSTDKLVGILSKSNISINAGIFSYTLDNFGNVTKLREFYKTYSTSSSIQVNTIYESNSQSEKEDKFVWIRRSDLLGVNFNAISS